MKRLLPAALVLAVLGAAAFCFLKMRGFLPERPRGAELAPAEAIFFVQVPNVRQSALRFLQTDLFQIWREPEVQAFLEKPRRTAPWMREWEERFDEIARVAPGEAFVAVTSIDGPRPGFAGGFSFAGSRRHTAALVEHLREKFPGGELVSSFRANWFLFASSPELLDAMLERFGGKQTMSLRGDAVFQRTIAPVSVGQDVVIYGKPDAFSAWLKFANLGGPNPAAQPPIAMATKIEGRKLHDTIFLSGDRPRVSATLSRHTLELAPPRTLAFYAVNTGLFPPELKPDWPRMFLPDVVSIEKALAVKGLTWSDLPAAFGPELGAVLDWPDDAALPGVLLAAEIRTPEKARQFADAITGPLASGSPWQSEDRAGVTVFHAPPQAFSFVRPALALTDRFALLGLGSEALDGVLPQLQTGGPSLAKTAAFQDAVRFIPAQAAAFGYLDFRQLFERGYRMTRPFITLSLAFSAEAGAQFDGGKLPPVEAVSKHLSATVLAQTSIEGGMLVESAGSLTLPDLLLAAAAARVAGASPGLDGALSSGLKRVGPMPSPAPARKPGSPASARTPEH